MKIRLIVFTLIALTSLIIGCSNSSNPTVPSTGESETAVNVNEMTITPQSEATSNRFLWTYTNIIIDPETLEFQIVPARDTLTHWNIRTILEDNPCNDCFKLVSIEPGPDETFLIDIALINPFPALPAGNLYFTAFDVRGIMMFNASLAFPALYRTASNATLGDGELVNADGYTSLYNKWTEGSEPGGLQGYSQGRYATDIAPNSLVNGYKRHNSITPWLWYDKNFLVPQDSIQNTYEIDFPDGQFVIGYAVDCSWSVPDLQFFDDCADFPEESPCVEPWKIEVTVEPIGYGLNDQGGSTQLFIDVYDWQGPSTITAPVIEVPGIFNGLIEAEFIESTGSGFQGTISRYSALITNEVPGPVGDYTCLIQVSDSENPGSPWWLDLSAYMLHKLTVVEYVETNCIAIVDANPVYQDPDVDIQFSGSQSFDPDGGDIVKYEWDWDNDGIYDEEGVDPLHSYTIYGPHLIQLRVTDDEGSTDTLDEPWGVFIIDEGPEFNPEIMTPNWLYTNPFEVDIQGDYAYITSAGPMAKGFFVMDITDPVKPKYISSIETGLPSAANLVVDGDFAYTFGKYDCKFNIIDISDPLNPFILNTLQLDYIFPPVRDLVIDNGYAYLPYDGLFIIDIDPPQDAYLVKIVDSFNMSNRAMYCAVKDGYAYVTTSMEDVRIVDIDPPEDAAEVAVINGLEGYPKGLDSEGDYLYLTGDTLYIFDISNPVSPVLINEINADGVKIKVTGGYAYMVARYVNEPCSFNIVDVDPPGSAELIYSTETVYAPHNLDVENGLAAIAISTSPYYLSPNGLVLLDILNPETPLPLHVYNHITNIIGASVTSDFIFILDDRYPGIHIIDKSEPGSQNIYKTFQLPVVARTMTTEGGYTYVSTDDGSLIVIDIEPIEAMQIVHTVEADVKELVVSNDLLFSYNDLNQVSIFDITQPESMYHLSTIDVPSTIRDFAVGNGYLYVASYHSIHIFDVSDPVSPFTANTILLESAIKEIAYKDGYLYSVQGNLEVIDVDPVETSGVVQTIEYSGYWLSYIGDLEIVGNQAWVLDSYELFIVDISVPEWAYVYEPDGLTYPSSDKIIPDGQYVHFIGERYYMIKMYD